MAKEAGLLYAVVAMATDYDCWRDCEDNVHAADVIKVFKQNVNKIRHLLTKAVKHIGEKNWDKEINALHVIIIKYLSSKENINNSILQKNKTKFFFFFQELCQSSNVSSHTL